MSRTLRTMTVAVLLCLPLGWLSAAWGQNLLGGTESSVQKGLAKFDQGQQLLATNRDAAQRNFLAAARELERVAASGVNNGKLEYNIGNCYLQAGRIGEAIVHYRRASKLIPGDALLADNLKEARSRRLTVIAPKSSTSFLRGLFVLHYATSQVTRMQIALGVYLAFWLVLLVRMFYRQRALSIAAIVLLFIGCTLAVSISVERWQDRNAPPGVIVEMDVAAFNGPGAEYQRKFEQPLQPGVEFVRRSKRGNWWKVELPDGNIGWIKSDTAKLVPRSVS